MCHACWVFFPFERSNTPNRFHFTSTSLSFLFLFFFWGLRTCLVAKEPPNSENTCHGTIFYFWFTHICMQPSGAHMFFLTFRCHLNSIRHNSGSTKYRRDLRDHILGPWAFLFFPIASLLLFFHCFIHMSHNL